MPYPAITAAILETLEDRSLRAAVYPTAAEQYMVELINRARANPPAEAARYSGYKDSHGNVYNGQLNEGLPAGTISTAAKQPLAVNPYITDAARKHSQWMVDNDTFSHTGAGGSNPGQRMASAGYSNATTWGENIAVNWSSGSLNSTTTVFDQHRNLFTDMPIADRGHRTNMMGSNFREVGVGVGTGPWVVSGYGSMNSLDTTTDFGARGVLYLTGVAFKDTVTDDDFYTPGEGLGSISVVATRTSDGASFSTSTWTVGGYSLALTSGTYNITASGTGLGSPISYSNVIISSQNVKRDFLAGAVVDPTPTPTPTPTPPPSVLLVTTKMVGRTLVVTGTAASDTINAWSSGTLIKVQAGSYAASFRTSAIDVVAILGNAGDDRITVTALASTFIEGGDGKDRITGGVGADTIYGNAQPDYLDGGAGRDQLVGAGGHDVIYGGDDVDRIYGNAGNDTVDAGAGSDRVYGGDGDDLLAGGVGNDILYGEVGKDFLHGGRHNDTADTDAQDTRVAIEILQ